ncbi:cytochrome D1 domain-containing protein [Aliikangiella sp. G2MR2-5]|uniref:cytochrome D1 domain-containing protein n=1 Tax=Aliikangiella sp. G2MR2-5 TaxID=2788943 RepID=UPI0018AAFEDE|nr:cytochrome D1 domain-containing protein [Aliikangiella sp. G2MR2-5]
MKTWFKLGVSLFLYLLLGFEVSACVTGRSTGDMGIIIERASGSLLVVEHSHNKILCRVEGLGDLSHASAVYSRDQAFAYIFARDGGLSKVDLREGKVVKRIIQGGNSIGGAISQSGKYIAVSNYEPGGVKIFNSDDLTLVADIPAPIEGSDKRSKTVGLVDIPGEQFVYSSFEGNDIFKVDLTSPEKPQVTRIQNVGRQPYDALVSDDGRFYIAGLFGEDGLALVDLWEKELKAKRILNHYGKGEKKFPVYKMPHLEGWAMNRDNAFLPAIGQRQLLVLDLQNWKEETRIDVKANPVFAMAQPDGRQIWVNFAFPDNQWLQVIDAVSKKVVKTIEAGKGVLHMEFTPRGERVWVSVRNKNEVQIYDTRTLEKVSTLPAQSPSGIFFTNRAHKIGL